MGANDSRGGVIFDPRSMIRRIYVKLHIAMLHIKALACGFREEDFLHDCISRFKTMADDDAPGAGPI